MDTVKVTNKGNNIKSTGDEAWETEYTWNKFNDKCSEFPGEEAYYTSVYHSSSSSSDLLSLVSKSGFANTGFSNGENHIKTMLLLFRYETSDYWKA